MADHIERVTEVTDKEDGNVFRERTTKETEGNYYVSLASRIVGFLGGLLILLLVFRFVLVLLNANAGNWFANFIYETSHPFVSPFFDLFNYNKPLGDANFEIYTLVAIVVYAVITYLIIRLINIGSGDDS